MAGAGIAVILSGFPRRSETFALHELLALQERGDLAAVFATKLGDGLPPHPNSEGLVERIEYLPPGDAIAQAQALEERLCGRQVAALHGYFAHTPAEVAEQVAKRMHLPFGFSVHARDARKVAPEELTRRARAACCVVACNVDVAQHFSASDIPLHILPHGVDTQRFAPQSPLHPLHSVLDPVFDSVLDPESPVRLLAAGRLVEKKGFDLLIRAVELLSIPFQLRIVGDGPQREDLLHLILEAKLGERVKVCPSVTHEELPALYAAADVVVVPSVIDQNGDRDGLPNVILEAMACGRAVVASDTGAVSSAIRSGQNGLITPARDVAALAAAIEKVAGDPALRARLGQQARGEVENRFELKACTSRFCDFLEVVYGIKGSAS